MEMQDAMKWARLVVDNPKHWEDTCKQVVEELMDTNDAVAERAYAIFNDKMEKKRKRSEAAKKHRNEQSKKKEQSEQSEQKFYNPAEHNQHQENNQ